MSFQTKASLASRFQDGDRPDGTDFQNLIDSMPAIPTAASTFPVFISVESTGATSARPVGAVGAQIVAATATSQVANILDVPASIAHTTFGRALVSAANTAAAQAILGIISAGAVGSALAVASTTVAAQQRIDIDRATINAFILSPRARLYPLERRARFPYTVDWFEAISSAGHCQITLLADTSILTGLASAAVDVTEVIVTASATRNIAAGETLNLRISDVSASDALAITIGITRT